ncbi:hypothetical protein PVK06_013600 [Gossypium arboreum]|uniref:Uncharacterized protein n=1 Tax=Gossypium arboreum TaxID=29729 RepID=A0ABR0PSE1_GOSAR|nr:hypothetical protein PVK06_013600 [Gossypium arboreum]
MPDVITPIAVGHHHHWMFVDNVNILTVRARASKNEREGDEKKKKKTTNGGSTATDEREKGEPLENVAPPLAKENKLALRTSGKVLISVAITPRVLSHARDMVFGLFGPKGIGLCSSFNHGFNWVQDVDIQEKQYFTSDTSKNLDVDEMTEAEVQMFDVNNMTKTRKVKSLYEIEKQRITKLEIANESLSDFDLENRRCHGSPKSSTPHGAKRGHHGAEQATRGATSSEGCRIETEEPKMSWNMVETSSMRWRSLKGLKDSERLWKWLDPFGIG